MTKAISVMNTKEIRARIVELDQLDAEFSSRNFDAELSAALLSGDNVDALEQHQLDSERQARRLRVERQALTAALPEAIKREAQPVIDAKKSQHGKLATDATKTVEALIGQWQVLERIIDRWKLQRAESVLLTQEAVEVARGAGLPTPQLGAFVDQNLLTVAMTMRTEIHQLAGSAEHGISAGKLHQAFELSR